MPTRYTKPQLEQLITDYADGYRIDPAIAIAQLRRESDNYRDDVVYGPFVGGAKERGIAQFTPATWATFGSRYGPHNPNAYEVEYSLSAWGDYMTYLLGLFNGDIYKALVGYNGGPGHLTDPAKHGPPSQAALRYGTEVLERAGRGDLGAGAEPVIKFEGDPDYVDPDSTGDYLKNLFGSGATTAGSGLLLIGGLALVGILLIRK